MWRAFTRRFRKAHRRRIRHGRAQRLKRNLLDALPRVISSKCRPAWSRRNSRRSAQIEGSRSHRGRSTRGADKSEEQLKQEYRDIAVRRVKLGYCCPRSVASTTSRSPNDELSRAIVNEARRPPGQRASVLEYYQKTPQAQCSCGGADHEEKCVDFILDWRP